MRKKEKEKVKNIPRPHSLPFPYHVVFAMAATAKAGSG
jgi:hypothetical protein